MEMVRWAAMALPAWHCVAFSAGQGTVCGEPAVRPRKGQACQTGSVCVSRGVPPLECAVSQGRSGAGRPALFRGFLEKHTSKCSPLKLLCGERHVC